MLVMMLITQKWMMIKGQNGVDDDRTVMMMMMMITQ
jgi:hypothetical protein